MNNEYENTSIDSDLNVRNVFSETAGSEDASVVDEAQQKKMILAAVNEVLDDYYPYKTLNAATDFDRFRLLFADKVPQFANQVSDNQLKMYLFTAGGTLIGSLKPREERLKYLRSIGGDSALTLPEPAAQPAPRYSIKLKSSVSSQNTPDFGAGIPLDAEEQVLETKDVADSSTGAAPVTPAESEPRESNSSYVSEDEYGDRMGRAPYEGDGYGAYGDRRYGYAPNYRDDRRGYYDANYDRQGYGSEPRWGRQDDYDRRDDYRLGYGYGRVNNGRANEYYGRPDERGGWRNERYAGRPNYDSGNNYNRNSYGNYGRQDFRQGAYADNYASNAEQRSSMQSARGVGASPRGYVEGGQNDVNRGITRRPSASDSQQDDFRRQRPEIVEFARDVIEKHFPSRNIRFIAEFQRFRQLLALKFPTLSFDDNQVRMIISYAGGTYVGPVARSSNYASGSPLGAHTRSARTAGGADRSPLAGANQARERVVIRAATEILQTNFPGKIVYDPDGIELFSELFYKKFPGVKLPKETIRHMLVVVGAVMRQRNMEDGSLTTEDALKPVYVDIAKVVLAKHFPNAVFQKDLSDFRRFRRQFEVEAGPGAVLDDEALREAFLAAGGVFVEGVPEDVEQLPNNFSRATVVKKVVCDYFADGIDVGSHKDLEKFRDLAKIYGMDFSSETDSKLKGYISRGCVEYKGKFYSATEKAKENIKKRVAALFSVGEQIVYYDSFFEKNKDWLSRANITSSGILQGFLVKFYSKYLFYPDFFQQDPCDDSERAKIEREIKRVWGKTQLISAKALSERLCVPLDRITKALELNVSEFTQVNPGVFERNTKNPVVVDLDELDDAFDDAFYIEEEKPEEVKKHTSRSLFDSLKDEDSGESFVQKKFDEWFDAGGTVIYYESFIERWNDELKAWELDSLEALEELVQSLYPDYTFYETFVLKEDLELTEEEIVKKELTHIWTEETSARRTIELVGLSYIPKDTLFDVLSGDPGYECRSNGYWVRTPKKPEGQKKVRRVLKRKSSKSK